MKRNYFNEHILPVKDKLYRFAQSILKNAMEAEDVVQEVLVKVWQRQDTWHEIENIEALTMRMTKNLALDKLRSRHNRTDTLPEHTEWQDQQARPDECTEQSDLIRYVQQQMHNLPEKHRLVMQLRDIEGMSYEEIGEVLDMTMSQVKTNLFRARQHIREHLLKNEIV